jgi:hypothetical protein
LLLLGWHWRVAVPGGGKTKPLTLQPVALLGPAGRAVVQAPELQQAQPLVLHGPAVRLVARPQGPAAPAALVLAALPRLKSAKPKPPP